MQVKSWEARIEEINILSEELQLREEVMMAPKPLEYTSDLESVSDTQFLDTPSLLSPSDSAAETPLHRPDSGILVSPETGAKVLSTLEESDLPVTTEEMIITQPVVVTSGSYHDQLAGDIYRPSSPVRMVSMELENIQGHTTPAGTVYVQQPAPKEGRAHKDAAVSKDDDNDYGSSVDPVVSPVDSSDKPKEVTSIESAIVLDNDKPVMKTQEAVTTSLELGLAKTPLQPGSHKATSEIMMFKPQKEEDLDVLETQETMPESEERDLDPEKDESMDMLGVEERDPKPQKDVEIEMLKREQIGKSQDMKEAEIVEPENVEEMSKFEGPDKGKEQDMLGAKEKDLPAKYKEMQESETQKDEGLDLLEKTEDGSPTQEYTETDVTEKSETVPKPLSEVETSISEIEEVLPESYREIDVTASTNRMELVKSQELREKEPDQTEPYSAFHQTEVPEEVLLSNPVEQQLPQGKLEVTKLETEESYLQPLKEQKGQTTQVKVTSTETYSEFDVSEPEVKVLDLGPLKKLETTRTEVKVTPKTLNELEVLEHEVPGSQQGPVEQLETSELKIKISPEKVYGEFDLSQDDAKMSEQGPTVELETSKAIEKPLKEQSKHEVIVSTPVRADELKTSKTETEISPSQHVSKHKVMMQDTGSTDELETSDSQPRRHVAQLDTSRSEMEIELAQSYGEFDPATNESLMSVPSRYTACMTLQMQPEVADVTPQVSHHAFLLLHAHNKSWLFIYMEWNSIHLFLSYYIYYKEGMFV